MKLKHILIGSAIAAVVMIVSNPSKERYSEYASEKYAEIFKESVCSIKDIPVPNYEQLCRFAMSQSKAVSKPVLEKGIFFATEQKNFILFSLFVTDMPNEKITTIAAFGNFIMFK